MMRRREVRGFSTLPVPHSVHHLNRQIPPEAHTPMYVWHKFWGRKTWNVVGEYIKAYCPEGGIVLDPFAGSGVVAMEAAKAKRRVITCDLLPVATEIARLTLKPVDLDRLRRAFERVETKVKKKILELYLTQCRSCRFEFPFDCAVWDRGKCVEIRYAACPRCGDRREKDSPLNKYDLLLLRRIERKRLSAWYPRSSDFVCPPSRPRGMDVERRFPRRKCAPFTYEDDRHPRRNRNQERIRHLDRPPRTKRPFGRSISPTARTTERLCHYPKSRGFSRYCLDT